MRYVRCMPIAAVAVALVGCTHTVKVEPIKIEPIHLTLDVKVQIDRRIEEFYDFTDEIDAEVLDAEVEGSSDEGVEPS